MTNTVKEIRPWEGPQSEFCQRREDVVYFGGAKYGAKSYGLLLDATYQLSKPGYKALILRRDFPRLQEMIDRGHEIYGGLGAKWSGDLHRFMFKNGNFIEFGHCQNEEDKRRYQGKEYQYIGWDQIEEFTESQFDFVNLANRTGTLGIECYVRVTGNPGASGHFWVKRRFIDGKKPRETYETFTKLPNGKIISRTYCFIPSKLSDNPKLSELNPGYYALFELMADDEKRALRDGDWEVYGSKSIFVQTKDLAEGMKAQDKMVEIPSFVGNLKVQGDELVPEPDELGSLSMWRNPIEGRRYFLSADIAKGVQGGNFSSAKVWDMETWGLCAKLYGHFDPLKFGDMLYNLGAYYMWAEIAVEVWPGPGSGTGSKLLELKYPNLYKRWEWDKETRVQSAEVGWVTDQRSRHEMLGALMEAVRRRQCIIRDQPTLDEMLSFCRNERTGKPEARSGCQDDQVIDTAIAIYCMRINPVKEMMDPEKQDKAIIVTNLMGKSKGPRLGRYHERQKIR